MDSRWIFQLLAATLFATYLVVHLTVFELRLRRSVSHSAVMERRQFAIVGQNAKAFAAVALVPLVVGVVFLLMDRTWAIVPLLFGQALGWITLTHWLGYRRMIERPPMEGIRERSLTHDAIWLCASIVAAGAIIYARTRDVTMLVWLAPMSLFAAIGLFVVRTMTRRSGGR